MSDYQSFIKHFEGSVKQNWELLAITEYKKIDKSYAKVAYDIEMLHFIWSKIGLVEGDKIGICANSCCEWVEVFMAVVTGGYVAVILQPNTSPEVINKLVIHSDCKLLYVDKNLVPSDFNLLNCRVVDIRYSINVPNGNYSDYVGLLQHYSNNYPFGVDRAAINYHSRTPEDICTIIYTSGSTGIPKGTMLSVQYFDANSRKLLNRYKHASGDSDVCVNPVYHIFALGGDILASLVSGMRLVLLPKPTPDIILGALSEYKPHKIFAVPIFLYSILKLSVGAELFTAIENGEPSIFEKSADYYIEIENILQHYLGGHLDTFLTGGVSLNHNVERFLVEKLRFPLVTVYGMTESGPVSYGIVGQHKLLSAGKIVNENKVRINSEDPVNIPGEIQIKENLFSGYYKDPQSTKLAFTEDGWLHSGDMGVIDHNGNIFITGRCKDMLLLSGGENIYPEDIESVINQSPYVVESLLYQKGDKLKVLIYPDYQAAHEDSLDQDMLYLEIEKVVKKANLDIPGFSIIRSFTVLEKPLERTPKGSIKRYLYCEK